MNFFILAAMIGSVVLVTLIPDNKKEQDFFLKKEKKVLAVNKYEIKNDLVKRVRESEKEIDYWNSKLDKMAEKRNQ